MTQPSGAREPRRTARPASEESGFERGRMTSSSKTSAPAKVARSDAPETVGTSCRSSRAISPRKPPASKKSCIRYFPDGRRLARTGTLRESSSKRARSSGDAGPARHGDQVDDRVGRAAQRQHDGDGVLEVLRSERERREGRRCGAPRRPPSADGPSARPGSRRRRAWSRPSASTAEVIVDAVPIVMQCPGEEAIACSTSSQSACVMFPARSSAQYFQTSDPEPKVSPRQCARSIGPQGTKMNGRPQDNAPMTSAGVVLSHPPSSTAASNGYDRRSSSVSRAEQVPVEHRGGLLERLAQRDRRHLQRKPAGLPDTPLDVLSTRHADACGTD